MEIILTRSEIENEDIEALRTALAAEDARSNDMLFPDAEDVKIGNLYVRIKLNGLWYNWSRRRLNTAVIDGHIYPLHGEGFLRVNCVTSQEEFEAEKQRLTEHADLVKGALREACDDAVQKVEEGLQEHLDKLDKEFMLQIG